VRSPPVARSGGLRMGHPGGLGWVEEGGRAPHDAHLSDDEAVAKMGHPVLWWAEENGQRQEQKQIPAG
jgi:hypothetical protein